MVFLRKIFRFGGVCVCVCKIFGFTPKYLYHEKDKYYTFMRNSWYNRYYHFSSGQYVTDVKQIFEDRSSYQ